MKIILPKGILIVFEGIDGSGKSTQLQNVYKQLDTTGLDCIKTKEPTDGVYGRRIRQSAETGRLPPEEELNLFLEDRKEHIKNVITPALQKGQVVLQDRYYLSTAAYQGVRVFDCENIMKMNEAFAPEPDMCILLEVSPEVFIDRIISRSGVGDTFEKFDELKIVAENFKKIRRDYIIRFNGSLSINKLTKEIIKAVFLGPLLTQLYKISDNASRKMIFNRCTDILVQSDF